MIRRWRARRKMRWAVRTARIAKKYGYDLVGRTRIGSQTVATFGRKDGSAHGIISPAAVAAVMDMKRDD